MDNPTRAFAFLVLASALLLSPGCAQGGTPAQNASGSAARFVLPLSDVSYHARYTVEEGDSMAKEVWRAPGRMRIDLSAQGMRALSFFFVDSKAYSCSYLSQAPACYDVTATLAQGDANKLAPTMRDVEGATTVESVKIGNTVGSCYSVSAGFIGARKLCFAPQGVVAFDSYNVSKTVRHTEYLADIEYFTDGQGPDASVFSLPAAPQVAPEAPFSGEGIGDLPA